MDAIIALLVIGAVVGYIWKRKQAGPKPNTSTPPNDTTAPDSAENSDQG